MEKQAAAYCDDNYKHDNMNHGAANWSEEEDQKLIHHVTTHGEASWRSLSLTAGLVRSAKSCKQRWFNYLRPRHHDLIKSGKYFGEDEDDLIIRLHALLGNKWSLIAGRLPGRTDDEIKNYWNSHLRQKLVKLGIDPDNHHLHCNMSASSTTKSLDAIEKTDSRNDSNSTEDQESSTSAPLVT